LSPRPSQEIDNGSFGDARDEGGLSAFLRIVPVAIPIDFIPNHADEIFGLLIVVN
jgi:hypothetical protein